MIARAFAFALLAYLLGFILFAFTLPREAPVGQRADAAVVLTGGPGRIEHAVDVLARGDVKRVLVAGADPLVTKDDIARRVKGQARLVRCCVDLGSESVDTRSNAEEASRWLTRHRYRSLVLVTSNWHMRRSRYEFAKVLGNRYALTTDAVASEPGFVTLFGEYNKFVLRRLAVWIDL
ncbi:MAG: YdcF family protein [Sphingomicrobium sp.]